MMTLRTRLLCAVVLALLAGMILGGVITVWQARQSVAVEVDAALAVGRQTAGSALAALGASADLQTDLERLIASFDGDRHIRASLIDGAGHATVRSVLARTADTVPDWFTTAIGANREIADIPVPGQPARSVRLETDPANELVEVWRSFKDVALVITLLCAAAFGFIWLAIGRALRPLRAFGEALRSVGEGRFEARLPTGGPPETQPIAAAFNRMAEALSAARERNLALYRQLLSAQEAERGDIARDLHDEIGPLLFAINIEAAAIGGAGNEAAAEATRSIRETVRLLQSRIRAIVNRLRPVGLAEFGLGRALEGLVEFWRRLHPGVAFRLDLPEGLTGFGELSDITAYRIIQEALNNALRHGRPGAVRISLTAIGEPAREMMVEIADDGEGRAAIEPGFGLLGMHERVRAAGGRLAMRSRPGAGFTITAHLPLDEPAGCAP
jgi:two-component system sensor histidine kinase UhpB